MKLLQSLPEIMRQVEDEGAVVLLFRDATGQFVVVVDAPGAMRKELTRAPSLMALAQQMMS